MDVLMAYSDEDGSLKYRFDNSYIVDKPHKPIKIKNCPQILLNYIEKLYYSKEKNELKTILCKAVAENQRMIIQEFKTLYEQLVKDGFNSDEIVEIIAYLYSRNYEFFNGSNHAEFLKIELLNPTIFKYNQYYNYATQAKNIIDYEGHIVAQNKKLDKEMRKILTFGGFLEIPEILLNMIVSTSNKEYYAEEKKKAQKLELDTLFQKAADNEKDLTIKEIERIKALMAYFKYEISEIDATYNYLLNRYNLRNENKKIESTFDIKEQHKKAKELLNYYFTYVNGNLTLHTSLIIPEEEIKEITEALQIIGCTKKRIAELVNEINKHNKITIESKTQEQAELLKEQLFNLLNNDETIKFSADVNILYEHALNLITNFNKDLILQNYIKKLSDSINSINLVISNLIYIDEITIMSVAFTDDDILNLQIAFLEIDECFENIYLIQPQIRKRLVNNYN